VSPGLVRASRVEFLESNAGKKCVPFSVGERQDRTFGILRVAHLDRAFDKSDLDACCRVARATLEPLRRYIIGAPHFLHLHLYDQPPNARSGGLLEFASGIVYVTDGSLASADHSADPEVELQKRPTKSHHVVAGR
jgi:hypothetical protein